MNRSNVLSSSLIFLLLASLCLLLTGCSQGPDRKTINEQLQSGLNNTFGEGALSMVDFTRRGGQPYTSEQGESAYLIYFTTQLHFSDQWSSQQWDTVQTGKLHSLLNISQDGLSAINTQTIDGETSLTINGFVAYIKEQGQWMPFKRESMATNTTPRITPAAKT